MFDANCIIYIKLYRILCYRFLQFEPYMVWFSDWKNRQTAYSVHLHFIPNYIKPDRKQP